MSESQRATDTFERGQLHAELTGCNEQESDRDLVIKSLLFYRILIEKLCSIFISNVAEWPADKEAHAIMHEMAKKNCDLATKPPGALGAKTRYESCAKSVRDWQRVINRTLPEIGMNETSALIEISQSIRERLSTIVKELEDILPELGIATIKQKKGEAQDGSDTYNLHFCFQNEVVSEGDCVMYYGDPRSFTLGTSED